MGQADQSFFPFFFFFFFLCLLHLSRDPTAHEQARAPADDGDSGSGSDSEEDEALDAQLDGYFSSYTHFGIHKEMLQDTVPATSFSSFSIFLSPLSHAAYDDDNHMLRDYVNANKL